MNPVGIHRLSRGLNNGGSGERSETQTTKHFGSIGKSGCVATFNNQQESDWSGRPGSVSCSHPKQLVDELNLLPNIRTGRLPSSSSTSRNESVYRRYQHTAQRISSGSVCRHLKIAGRIVFFMVSSGYQAPSAKVATQPTAGSGADRIVGAIRSGVRCGDADYAAMT